MIYMNHPCNRLTANVYFHITVEAAILIALTFLTLASFIITSAMARKKKSGAAKRIFDANGALLTPQEMDPRPESSPYGSPICTVPFQSPLAVPRDILIKSPKLHAAFEDKLPELPLLSEDVGHVLVHYLHTGTYETLKPKPVDNLTQQLVELKTSIQAYAAARAYELPDLMKLAEAKIEKFGSGIPLPALLEVARDAHPTLNDNDDWFLDFLRARIRPHLKDAKALKETDLLDRISSILSPNRVLLRTVLELFCENIINNKPQPAPQPQQQQEQQQQQQQQQQQPHTPKKAPTEPLSSPITSPGSSRPGSPLPSTPGNMSALDLRSRSIIREDSYSSPSSKKKAVPWSSSDDVTVVDGWSNQEISADPLQTVETPVQVEEAQSKPMFELDEPIAEPVPTVEEIEPELVIEEKEVAAPAAAEREIKHEPALKSIAEESEEEVKEHYKEVVEEIRRTKSHELGEKATPSELEPELKLAVEPVTETEVKPEPTVESEAAPVPAQEETKEEPKEEKKEDKTDVSIAVPLKQRERSDSGKLMELEESSEPQFNILPVPQESAAQIPIPVVIPESMPEIKPAAIQRSILRQTDSGFWEDPHSETVSLKDRDSAPSVVDIPVASASEPVPTPAVKEEPKEAETVAASDDKEVVDTKVEAELEAPVEKKAEDKAEKESAITSPITHEIVSEPVTEESESALKSALSATLPSPKHEAALPAKLELPAEILEAASSPLVENVEAKEKEKSVSPQPEPSATEEAQLPVDAAEATSSAADNNVPSDKVQDAITQAPVAEENTNSVPNADLPVGPAHTEEPQPVVVVHDEQKEEAPVESVPVSNSLTRSLSRKSKRNVSLSGANPRSSASSLHLGLRRTRSKLSFRGSKNALPISGKDKDAVVPVSASGSAQAAQPEAQQSASGQKHPHVVSGKESQSHASSGGWKKRFLRYPVLFGRGM
ncbi:hypothetical protein QBC35DRAFT_91736 [Podospora australis]|uniref:Uncharacterized protein n=1 Tax=Podospora australis TaxID=1536484 RepID=A0AAN7AF77_9PEZI|nr:hypothetical protein QBC35DRAFT_91736 [Podospora australis]